jgi:hypothetical protein
LGQVAGPNMWNPRSLGLEHETWILLKVS